MRGVCFHLQVSNELGKDTLDLNVTVLDRPGPVRRLKSAVEDSKANAALVTWDEPKDHGGTPITGYLVERREANKRSWTSVGPAEPGLNKVIPDLTPNTSYFFRVMAQNNSGCSEPAETDTPLVIPCKTSGFLPLIGNNGVFLHEKFNGTRFNYHSIIEI